MKVLRDRKGAYLTMTALLLPICLLIAAVFVDAGTLYVSKGNFQNAADAAALAGAQELPDRDEAAASARRYIAANGIDAKSVAITFSDDGEHYEVNAGGKYCRVIYSAPAKSLIMSAIVGQQDIRVRATAMRGGNMSEANYAVFAGDGTSSDRQHALYISSSDCHINGGLCTNNGVLLQASGKSNLTNGAITVYLPEGKTESDVATIQGGYTGSSTFNFPSEKTPMPDLSQAVEDYIQAAKAGSADVEYSSGSRNIVLGANAHLKKVIIAEGDIVITAAGNAFFDAPLIASRRGKIIVQSSGRNISGKTIFYAPNDEVIFQGSATHLVMTHGGIIGKSVSLLLSKININGNMDLSSFGGKIRLTE